MAAKGAHIVFTGRDMSKGKAVVASIIESTGNRNVEVMALDLSSLDSIRVFTDGFLSKYNALDILINNAGIMACPQWTTQDGFEMQFGTNHLGHFLLTNLQSLGFSP
jgi:NAD(P)-dependent dehydrogenase (short-subunit alcohol dehydrogenase family)